MQVLSANFIKNIFVGFLFILLLCPGWIHVILGYIIVQYVTLGTNPASDKEFYVYFHVDLFLFI